MPDLTLWKNLRLAPDASPSHVIDDACIVTHDKKIRWLGALAELPEKYREAETAKRDLTGALVTPGLIDCHTHLVFGGNRAQEFALRLEGASYEDIARQGGGIVSTVRATRNATEEALFTSALRRLDALMAEGVAAIEIKSGYGLDLESERKMLRVARRLGQA